MKFLTSTVALLTVSGVEVLAYPGKAFTSWGTGADSKTAATVVGRATDKCADAIQARGSQALIRRAARLMNRRLADGKITRADIAARNELKYAAIHNETSVLVPDADSASGLADIVRRDLREDQQGVDFYLDIAVIDLETCEPITDAHLTLWGADATGTYGGKRETFLRGTQATDDEGIVEFLTLFPGSEAARTPHMRVMVQTADGAAAVSSSDPTTSSPVRHTGEVFFDEDVIREVYTAAPYSTYQEEFSRVTNDQDAIYRAATADGHNAAVSVMRLGDDLSAGLIGYVSVNSPTS